MNIRRSIRIAVAFAITTAGLSTLACQWDYRIWIPRSASADAFYRFRKGEYIGFIDAKGNVVIPPVLHVGDRIHNFDSEFHDGLLSFKGAYFDKTGNKAIDGAGLDFSEGLALRRSRGAKDWEYIDGTGRVVMKAPIEVLWPTYYGSFFEGLAAGQKGDMFGYMDHSGNFVIQPQFLMALPFHEGYARVIIEGPCAFQLEDFPCQDSGNLPVSMDQEKKLQSCRYAFIDKSGRIISTNRFDGAKNFGEGLAPVRIGRKWGYVNQQGELAIRPKFDLAEPFADGRGRVYMGDAFGYVNHDGVLVIPAKFKHADDFSEGRAAVSDGNVFWYIGTDGKSAFPGKFYAASPYFKGLAHVRLVTPAGDRGRYSGVFAYIDKDGGEVFRYEP